ncbi:MAG: LamB/YcsF family protein, partial [Rhodobacteraceae bacterium]
ELDLPLCREAFIDREYTSDGNLQSRKIPGSVIRDPARAAGRAVRMVLDEEIVSVDGVRMPTAFDSLCVHGDEPTAIAVARAVRAGLEEAGVSIMTIPELMAAR